MRSSSALAIAAACLLACPALPAQDRFGSPGVGGTSNESLSEDEIEARYLARRRALAAEYRLERARVRPTLDEAYDAQAQDALERARSHLVAVRLDEARRVAERALEEWPYSAAAPELQHIVLRTRLASGRLVDAKLSLVDLWERHPGYGGIAVALRETLLVAELAQQRGDAIDLEAATPDEVVDPEMLGDLQGADRLFRFLIAHGGREVAARASLGLARSLLFQGRGDLLALVEARVAYDEFLDRFPDSDLVFTALIEQAVSYLLAYRGDQYDSGVLMTAQTIIDAAELYTEERPERVATVQRFRALIRRWLQERDLSIARWYHNRGRYEPAHRYYREVVDRDSTSPAAAAARRELAELPVETPTGLGTPIE